MCLKVTTMFKNGLAFSLSKNSTKKKFSSETHLSVDRIADVSAKSRITSCVVSPYPHLDIVITCWISSENLVFTLLQRATFATCYKYSSFGHMKIKQFVSRPKKNQFISSIVYKPGNDNVLMR